MLRGTFQPRRRHPAPLAPRIYILIISQTELLKFTSVRPRQPYMPAHTWIYEMSAGRMYYSHKNEKMLQATSNLPRRPENVLPCFL